MIISPIIAIPGLMRIHPRVACRGRMSVDFEQIDWTVVSNVKASERRTQVLRALCQKPRMNGELADELDLSTKWVRRQIKWLQKRDLVEDLTESKHNYKLYRATEDGEQIVEVL
jgi:predicted transcriptional regulator